MDDIFQTHTVDKLSEVAGFAEFLMGAARRGASSALSDTIAVAVRERQKRIAFSDRDNAWVLDCKSAAGPLAAGVLRTQLLDQAQIKLATRNLALDLPVLTKFFVDILGVTTREAYTNLAPALVSDLTSAAKCINQEVTPAQKFRRIEQDAYEVALLAPQYEYAIVPYYRKVGIPIAKAASETALFGKGVPAAWQVTYPDLWLRVLTYFSGEPTMTWAFHENRDPLEAVAKLLRCTAYEAELMLLWACCGRDMATFSKRFASVELPADLPAWNDRLDKAMPTLTMTSQMMQRSYWETRQVETFFHRKLRPGHPMGEAVAFRIFGSVEDIIGNAWATLWQNRLNTETLILGLKGGPAESAITIVGAGPKTNTEMMTWMQSLKMLAPLANPLSPLTLNPTIVELATESETSRLLTAAGITKS